MTKPSIPYKDLDQDTKLVLQSILQAQPVIINMAKELGDMDRAIEAAIVLLEKGYAEIQMFDDDDGITRYALLPKFDD